VKTASSQLLAPFMDFVGRASGPCTHCWSLSMPGLRKGSDVNDDEKFSMLYVVIIVTYSAAYLRIYDLGSAFVVYTCVLHRLSIGPITN
jgi:hypothetical protein